MNSRFKGFGGFGSRRLPSKNNVSSVPQQPSTTTLAPSASTNGLNHTPPGSTSSTTSLPMNPPQNGLGRPPSYTYNPNAPRAQSPMPPQQPVTHHPPPINTGAYPQGHPALGGAPQPPGYGGGYAQNQGMSAPQPTLGQYGGRGQAVEVEGAGRSKAQLIVGIDFVRKTSSNALALPSPLTHSRAPPFRVSHLRLRQTPKRKKTSSQNGLVQEIRPNKRYDLMPNCSARYNTDRYRYPRCSIMTNTKKSWAGAQI